MFLLFKLSLVYSPNSPIFGIRQPPRQFWWLTKCEQGKRGSCNASSHPSAARMLSHSSACTVTPQLCTLSCEKLCNATNIYLVKKKKKNTAHEEGTWPSLSNPSQLCHLVLQHRMAPGWFSPTECSPRGWFCIQSTQQES